MCGGVAGVGGIAEAKGETMKNDLQADLASQAAQEAEAYQAYLNREGY